MSVAPADAKQGLIKILSTPSSHTTASLRDEYCSLLATYASTPGVDASSDPLFAAGSLMYG
eukprot:CAMPEP_0197555072 /NCGR_PEP_ID=MMETSP1320-20131121/12614_1 /TAXON_ID=91990 /ORGANISM="Bolidomonas sp., Strain RCC2347" /LENGTH=60 /DNA_ID=CAMNT_0043116035 /DNA_START=6 /DNA_END=185 /DNA_ORIENTATION=+